MAAIEIKGDRMPEVLTECVSNSVAAIFNTIIGAEPVFEGDGEDRKLGDGVIGIISFVGDVSWLFMLVLPKKSAIEISSKFCGFDVEYESPDMGDVVGELANVLAGDIVSRLKAESITATMSLPTVMRGHDVEPLLPRGVPSEKMLFNLPEGRFMVRVAGASRSDLIGRTPGT